MTWPTNGAGGSGWEFLGVVVTTDPEVVPLPDVWRARWYDPTVLGGLGAPVPYVALLYGNAAVDVRQQSIRYEVTLERPELFGVALLDSFVVEVFEGAPCSVQLTIYDDDRLTPLWEVSTDPNHAYPYLVEPEDYGEQEIDVAKGAAVIGTVSLTAIDRRTIAGDQQSGFLTDKLAAVGLANLTGRRGRVVRFIEPALGYHVIADGPIATPKLDASYAGYNLTVRDTRETERKSRLTRGGDRSLFPFGVRNGYGFNPFAPLLAAWLIDPAPYLTGTFTAFASPAWDAFAYTPFKIDISGNPGSIRRMTSATLDALANPCRLPQWAGLFGAYNYAPQDAVFEWRLAGSLGAFNQVPVTGFGGGALGFGPETLTIITADIAVVGNDVTVDTLWFTGLSIFAGPGPGAMPNGGDAIEFRILGGKGTLTKDLPFYVDGITAGQFIQNAYDGLYSDLDEHGDTVPTGIRYDAAALAPMTDLVRLRLFDPVDDIRTWLETNIYQPTGWVPALDFDGRISPVSQAVPAATAGLPAITDAIAEAAPEWNAGETIYNVVRMVYQRDYLPATAAEIETVDGLADREVVVEYEDPVSVQRNGRQVLTVSGLAFRAWGDVTGAPYLALMPEAAALLAEARGTEMLNRYSLGAPTTRLAVFRRSLPLLRVGDWVVLSLSWLPDYVTRRRGLVALAQVVALHDLDCAWRRLTLEVVNSLAVS